MPRRRLSSGLLGAAILLVLAATVLPSEPEGEIRWDRVVCVLCGHAALADSVANVGLFLPLGVALGLGSFGQARALLLAATLSLSVELAQFIVPGRDPNLGDVLFNTLGAAIGGAVLHWARRGMALEARGAARRSLGVALVAVTVFGLTDVMLTTSIPATTYFGGSRSLLSSVGPLRLGGNTDPDGHFRGLIDEVRIYRRARTLLELRADMSAPVSSGSASPDLVAAYGFDEGSGEVVSDASGQGNTGRIVGAAWTTTGRFGRALRFDGAHDVVVIPHSPSLDLTTAMTLEAWTYPTAARTGGRAVIQKAYDVYFLGPGSPVGALRPGGGGRFSSSTERVAASNSIPSQAWSHLALTYDGAALMLYVNGDPVARKLRWYPGSVFDTSVGGVAIPAGGRAESGSLREQLVAGAPLRVHAVAASPVPTPAPMVTLHDEFRNEVLYFGAEGYDLVLRARTRAAALELDNPAIRVPGAMRGVNPGDDVVVTMTRSAHGYCVEVNRRATCGVGHTLGMGWGLFLYSQVSVGWPHVVLNALWMAALSLPVGVWVRRRWESFVALLLLGAGIVLPSAIGSLTMSPVEIAAAVVGLLVGIALRHGDTLGE